MAILFDLDGTLFDTGPDLHKALNQLLTELGVPKVQYERIKPIISLGSWKILQEVLDLPEAKLVAHRARFIELYKATGFSNSLPFPGVPELLADIQALGLNFAIVTNKITELAKPLVDSTKCTQNYAALVCGDTTDYTKPSPEPLLHACKTLGLSPKQCVYVGDAIIDVKAAKAAVMPAIVAGFGYVPSHNIDDWQADFVANSPLELSNWIREWQQC